ncbi:isoleucine--tRNA ligase [Natranaerofaba carboxydovora]|uniref:isoleucine--tRNA ligase n=1 Tax=Natranaerofaba carboxydovora TaxID=2742683 RepID=UPI001F1389ED|nr:isoleucine--tRNA ligase [Natranaerofaba carboxydovora]UMZ73282.1 Isoleucine--tRNA ligase [Natranaerofaba carboxydovora]
MNYKDTLNLPQTEFPMRAKLPKREPEILDEWEKVNIYEKVRKKREDKPKYILHDGPPYANGDIHMGTALNKVLKDIVVKFKTLQGYDSPYIPGWDTHGLPIEHQIIKTQKVDRHSMSDIEFRKKCHDYAMDYVKVQKEQFKRLGVRGDWENPYLTLSPEFEAEQIRVFGEMAEKGYIYKGLKPVYWCTTCETALAEAEVDYQDKRSPSIYVAFKVTDDKGLIGQDECEIVIWTTTPWTIPANMAIALHPDLEYSLVKDNENNRSYILASELVENVMKEIEISDYEELKKYQGKDLEGVITKHPLYERDSVVILGDHVGLDQGTGCVHTAPGHGQEDYEIGKKYDLEVLSPLDSKGVFTEEAGQFEGLLSYVEGNKAVTKALEKENALLKLDFVTHQYPVCWRCKEPILFRATKQWFASIDGFRKDALDEIENVKWVPSWGKMRIKGMVENRGDWCISRQRVWGVPIPIFYCNSCGTEVINKETIEAVSTLFEKEGSDAWFERSAAEILPDGFTCGQCGESDFDKETDIMDVWFDSGSTHRAVCEKREDLTSPVDLYLEGSDQYRGWFQSSLLTSVATRDRAPYKAVLTNGWVVDGDGRKMSKSLGNVMYPTEIIDQYGADILRLWVASSDFKEDVRVSNNILKQITEGYRKIRNTCRFILGNLYDFDPQKDMVAYEDMNELDRFALAKCEEVTRKVIDAYEKFDFHIFYHMVHNFCVVDMSQFYLDIIKDRLYTMPADSLTRRSSQTAMYIIIENLVRILSPVLTFTAEEVWKHLPGEREESVQIAVFNDNLDKYRDDKLKEKWESFLQFRDEVTKALEEARVDKKIGNSLEASVTIVADTGLYNEFKEFENQLDDLFLVSRAKITKSEESTEEEDVLVKHEIDGAKILVKPASGDKCPRCWKYDEIDKDSGICPRCVDVMASV